MDSSNSCVFFKSATCSTDGDSVSPSLSIANFLDKYRTHISSHKGKNIEQRLRNMELMITSLQRCGLSDDHIIEVGYCFNMSGSANFEKFCDYAKRKIFKFYSECDISDPALRQMFLKCIVMETIYRIVQNQESKKPTAKECSGIIVEYMALIALNSSREHCCDCGEGDFCLQHLWRGNDIGCKRCGSGFEIKSSYYGADRYAKQYGCHRILHCGKHSQMQWYNRKMYFAVPDEPMNLRHYINGKGLWTNKMCGDLKSRLDDIHFRVFSEDSKTYPEFCREMKFGK